MKKAHFNESMLHSALAGVLALAAGQVMAADMPKIPDMPAGWEACGGIAKAGLNDCGVRTSAHSCAAMAKKDGEPNSYIYLPKGQCERIVGGHVLNVTNEDVKDWKSRIMDMMKM